MFFQLTPFWHDKANPFGLAVRIMSGGAIRLMFCMVFIWLLLFVNHAEAADRFKPFKLKTLDGETRTQEDFRNKATLVAFFFPSCAYCNAAFPEMVRIYERYMDRGLSMVWINVLKEEENRIAGWLAEHKYTVPVLVGASLRSLQRDYNLKMTPEHYLLNSEGEILLKQTGYKAGDEREIEENVLKALSLLPQPSD